MSEWKQKIDKLVQELKQERDELRVKVHLAKMEASDEWKELEQKMGKLEDKAKDLGKTSAEASKDVGAAAKLLGKEIKDGFKKLASRF